MDITQEIGKKGCKTGVRFKKNDRIYTYSLTLLTQITN